MANSERRDTIILQYKVDQRALKAAQQSTRAVAQDIERLGQVVDVAGGSASAASKGIANLTNEINRQDAANATATQSAEELAAEYRNLMDVEMASEVAARQTAEEVVRVSDEAKKLTETPLFSGRVSAFLERIGADVGAEVLRAASGGIEAAEAFKAIGPAIKDTFSAAQSAIESVSSALSIGPGALLGAAGVAAVAVALVAAALVSAKQAAEDAAEAEQARIDGMRNAREQLIGMTSAEREQRLQSLRETAQVEEDIRQQSAEDAIATAQSVADIMPGYAEGLLGPDGIVSSLAEAQEFMRGLAGSIGGTFNPVLAASIAEFDTQTAAAEDARTNLERYNEEFLELTSTYADAYVAANDAREAEEDLARAREEEEENLARKREEAAAAAAQAAEAERQRVAQSEAARVGVEMETARRIEEMTTEQAKARLSQIETERVAIMGTIAELQALDTDEARAEIATLAERINALSEESSVLHQRVMPAIAAREAEVQAVRDQIDQENELVATRQREEQEAEAIAKITARGAEQRAKLEAEVAEKASDLTAQIKQAWDDLPDAIAEIDSDYMAASIERADSFRKQEARHEEDANARRLQRLRAMQASLMQAEEDNDVVAFIRAQRAGERQLSEMDAQASQSQRRRTEDFLAEQEARRVEREQRIAEVRAGTTERIAALENERKELAVQLQERLTEIKSATQKEIAELRDANAERLRQQEEADARRLDQQRRLDEALARSALVAHEQALSEMQNMGANYAAQMRSLITQARGMSSVASAATMASRLSRASDKRGSSPRGARGGRPPREHDSTAANQASQWGGLSGMLGVLRNLSGYGYPTQKFAFGGVVTSPTFGLLGERPGYKDVVQSMPIGANMTPSITINLGSIGSDLSRQEVARQLEALGVSLVRAVSAARTGGR